MIAFGMSAYECQKGSASTILSPERFHWRLPWYAKIGGPNNVTIDGDRQEVMDAELKYASYAGIDYFAYDTYCIWPTDQNISQCAGYWGGPTPTSVEYKPTDPAYALRRHLASEHAALVNISLVLLGAAPALPSMRRRYLPILQSPHYQRVLGVRPLVFLFQAGEPEAALNGGWAAWARQWADFRAESIAAGAGNPYFVAMGLEIPPLALRDHLNLDAVSAYALPTIHYPPAADAGGAAVGVPFRALLRKAQGFWEQVASAGVPLVPPVPTGWDPRPRAEMGCPWTKEKAAHYAQPNVSELGGMFASGARWLREHPAAAPAQAAIVYAWNEVSEGGMLIPTHGNGTDRLEAVRAVLRPAA